MIFLKNFVEEEVENFYKFEFLKPLSHKNALKTSLQFHPGQKLVKMCAKCGDFSAILDSTIGDFGDFQIANWRFLKILTWQHCREVSVLIKNINICFQISPVRKISNNFQL